MRKIVQFLIIFVFYFAINVVSSSKRYPCARLPGKKLDPACTRGRWGPDYSNNIEHEEIKQNTKFIVPLRAKKVE